MAQPDTAAQIRAFLTSQPGQHCEPCLVVGTGLEAKSVKAAFKPSKDNPYSFMQTWCSQCNTTAICVAYAGEISAQKKPSASA